MALFLLVNKRKGVNKNLSPPNFCTLNFSVPPVEHQRPLTSAVLQHDRDKELNLTSQNKGIRKKGFLTPLNQPWESPQDKGKRVSPSSLRQLLRPSASQF